MTDSAYPIGFKKYRRQASRIVNDPQSIQKVYLETVKKAEQHKGTLPGIWDELRTLVRMVRLWSKGSYREVSTQTKVLIIGGLLYFLSPIDLVPDFIAGLGLLDDAALLGWIISSLHGEISRFEEWESAGRPNL